MRCFISIELSEEVRANLSQLQRKLKSLIHGKQVEKQNLHICLKFLGEVAENKIKEVKKLIQEIKFESFELELQGVGAFPSENYIRILWAGIKDGEKIIELQKEVESKLSKLEFQKDSKFKPHITLARVRAVPDKNKLKQFIQENKEKTFGEFKVNKIHLIKSELTREGPVYCAI